MAEAVIVIGGGVSGITTALTLQLLGYDTTIYAHKTIDDIADKNDHPDFASLFPSASIIPHSVYTDRLEDLFKKSQYFFYELRKQSYPGLTIRRHYEIFEFSAEQPTYCSWMPNWQSIEEIEFDSIPRRNRKLPIFGWSFDCIFADWPLYFPALVERYQQSGGTIIQQELHADDIPKLPGSVIINCSGVGSAALFESDEEDQFLLRGHLLHKKGAPLITDSNQNIISYNYTPLPSQYSDYRGTPCDVYCYPRKDGWYLGGSRDLGTIDKQGKWQGPEPKCQHSTVNGCTIPEPIIDLNREILEQSFGLALDTSKDVDAMVGYRYIRKRNNGLRLEQETIAGKTIIHNYGHGGAGVTLSWGCAIDVAKQITNKQSSEIQIQILQKLNHRDF